MSEQLKYNLNINIKISVKVRENMADRIYVARKTFT